jgi:hypothetical protein
MDTLCVYRAGLYFVISGGLEVRGRSGMSGAMKTFIHQIHGC